ncbi:MAG: DUF5522 domain-containing protein [Bacteroidia bacterium]
MQDLPETEPDDYYINNNGLMVFTEKYHLKRGYCCNNNCLHCPYQEEKKKTNDYGSDQSTER